MVLLKVANCLRGITWLEQRSEYLLGTIPDLGLDVSIKSVRYGTRPEAISIAFLEPNSGFTNTCELLFHTLDIAIRDKLLQEMIDSVTYAMVSKLFAGIYDERDVSTPIEPLPTGVSFRHF